LEQIPGKGISVQKYVDFMQMQINGLGLKDGNCLFEAAVGEVEKRNQGKNH
jgi:hypothetical protein